MYTHTHSLAEHGVNQYIAEHSEKAECGKDIDKLPFAKDKLTPPQSKETTRSTLPTGPGSNPVALRPHGTREDTH